MNNILIDWKITIILRSITSIIIWHRIHLNYAHKSGYKKKTLFISINKLSFLTHSTHSTNWMNKNKRIFIYGLTISYLLYHLSHFFIKFLYRKKNIKTRTMSTGLVSSMCYKHILPAFSTWPTTCTYISSDWNFALNCFFSVFFVFVPSDERKQLNQKPRTKIKQNHMKLMKTLSLQKERKKKEIFSINFYLHGSHGKLTSISMGNFSARAQLNAASSGPACPIWSKPNTKHTNRAAAALRVILICSLRIHQKKQKEKENGEKFR